MPHLLLDIFLCHTFASRFLHQSPKLEVSCQHLHLLLSYVLGLAVHSCTKLGIRLVSIFDRLQYLSGVLIRSRRSLGNVRNLTNIQIRCEQSPDSMYNSCSTDRACTTSMCLQHTDPCECILKRTTMHTKRRRMPFSSPSFSVDKAINYYNSMS